MTAIIQFARFLTFVALLCTATNVFAQNRAAVTKEGGIPTKGLELESISKCQVIGGTQRPVSERNTAATGKFSRKVQMVALMRTGKNVI